MGIPTILGILKAIPILDSWFQNLMVAYTKSKIDSMKKENRDAIREDIQNHDQRELEKAIGSPTAGLPSGDPGAVILPGPPPGLSD
jgi:hypothetical protein